jgi:hypothetical protein
MMRLLMLVTGALLLAGCGSKDGLPKTYPVKGKVLDAQGAPLKGGTAMFQSKTDTTLTVSGTISETDGSFEVKTIRNKQQVAGAPEGEYEVTISLPLAGGPSDGTIGRGHAAPPPVTLPKLYRVEPKENTFEFRLSP